MATPRVTGSPEHVLRVTTRTAAVFVPIVFLGALAAGRPWMGVAAALGLLIGAANMMFADRLFRSGVPFMVTSGIRLVVLTASAFVIYFAAHTLAAIGFVVGVGVSQFMLAMVAAFEATKK